MNENKSPFCIGSLHGIEIYGVYYVKNVAYVATVVNIQTDIVNLRFYWHADFIYFSHSQHNCLFLVGNRL